MFSTTDISSKTSEKEGEKGDGNEDKKEDGDEDKNEDEDKKEDENKDEDTKEDFLLALFIAQQDPGELNQSKPDQDANDPKADFGHFCAPWVPGFCQANFCIFHHPAG